MIKVSILVPVYNVEKYIHACMDSIMKQTLSEIEIICIDDGSTDNSGYILDDYAQKDSRVQVIHQKNAGYGAAMNAGLRTARGEYIGIVESDDRICPQMYQVLYEKAVQNNLDLIKSDVFFWMESVGYKNRVHYNYLDDYYDKVLSENDRRVFFDFFMNIWTGIYRREFLEKNQIQFHETQGASYQDNGFWIQTLSFCDRAMWLSQAFYLYRLDNPIASVKSQSKIYAMAKEFEYAAQIMRQRKNKWGEAICYYFKLYRNVGTFLRIADEYKMQFCQQIQLDYQLYGQYIAENKSLVDWHEKICYDADRVCMSFVTEKKCIRKKLEEAKQLIIYGAGNRGHKIFRGLYNEGFYDKIFCFAVSKEPPKERIGNKTIVLIQNAVRQSPDALVIIAVVRGTNMYKQMVENLESLGVTDYLDGSDIEESFYIL